MDRIMIERPEVTLRDRVIDGIRDAMMSGDLRSGQRLTERQLIDLTGVSRTSVREALTHLQALGLVETSPARGLRVPVLNHKTVVEIYEARAALEPAVARHFVERATDVEVAKVLEFRDARSGLENRLQGIREMDDLLIAGARNSVLAEILDPLRTRIHALRRISMSIPGRADAALAEIRRLCDAIEKRDAGAAERAAREHVQAASIVALEALEKMDTAGATQEGGKQE